MAMVCRLLRRVAVGTVTVLLITSSLRAQGVFRIGFDTVTAHAGDTVTVNARYTFQPSGAHNISSYSARILWDTAEVHLVAFVLAGTATPPGDTGFGGTSHAGISAIGQSEIDLSNPVLFAVRFRVDRELADTAFVRWDTSGPLFSSNEGVGETIRTDGWVRTESVAGHVSIQTPGQTLKGYTLGYSPDSVYFSEPFLVSSIASAGMSSARLTFRYDPTRLVWQSASADSSVKIDSTSSTPLFGGLDSATIDVTSRSGLLQGNDTLVSLSMIGLIGFDTVCEALSDVMLRPLNADGLIGNTTYHFDSICLVWIPQSEAVEKSLPKQTSLFPNPAFDEVTIDVPDGENYSLMVYDAVGREVWRGELSGRVWEIPKSIAAGMYRLIVRSSSDLSSATGILVLEPR